jgi:hypothetical protein
LPMADGVRESAAGRETARDGTGVAEDVDRRDDVRSGTGRRGGMGRGGAPLGVSLAAERLLISLTLSPSAAVTGGLIGSGRSAGPFVRGETVSSAAATMALPASATYLPLSPSVAGSARRKLEERP